MVRNPLSPSSSLIVRAVVAQVIHVLVLVERQRRLGTTKSGRVRANDMLVDEFRISSSTTNIFAFVGLVQDVNCQRKATRTPAEIYPDGLADLLRNRLVVLLIDICLASAASIAFASVHFSVTAFFSASVVFSLVMKG